MMMIGDDDDVVMMMIGDDDDDSDDRYDDEDVVSTQVDELGLIEGRRDLSSCQNHTYIHEMNRWDG